MAERTVLRRLRAGLTQAADAPTDAELLDRFAAGRDTGAFELLVWRHAGLVLRVCRGVLKDHHAAEDAAQAVFLALARQAGQLGRPASAAGWLFRVARRVAARAARRRAGDRAKPVADLGSLPAPDVVPDPDLDRLVHDELARLPEAYRLPILLCFFEGLTHAQAAARLGWPVGTVAGRIARAKERLARRLSARGVSLTVAVPIVGGSFVSATAVAAAAFFGHRLPCVPSGVLELATREVRAMAAIRLLRVSAALATITGALALGLAWAAEPPPTPAPSPAPRTAPPALVKSPAPVVKGTFAVAPITTDLHRLLIGRADRSSVAIVFVDGNRVFPRPDTLNLDSLDLKGIRDALTAYRPASDRTVHFVTRYRQGGQEVHRVGSDLLTFGLEGLGRRSGFGRADAMELHDFAGWDDWVAPLQAADAVGDESGVGDERVRAYPVRTALSRLLTGSKDGVVDVRVLLNPLKEDWLPAGLDQSVRAASVGMKLTMGKKVLFKFNIRERDDRTLERVKELCERWAGEFGLEFGAVSY